jgi:hypothetical protein
MGRFNMLKTAMIGTIVFSLTACGAQEGAEDVNRGRVEQNGIQSEYMNNMDNMTHLDRVNQQKWSSLNEGNRPYVDYSTDNRVNFDVHKNRRVDLSKEIAEEITNMKEVKTANVLLTERNAYIAVVLEDGAADLGDNLGGTQDGIGMNSYDRGSDGMFGTNMNDNTNTARGDNGNTNNFFNRENTAYDRNNDQNDSRWLDGRNNAFTNRNENRANANTPNNNGTTNLEGQDVSMQLKNKIVSKVRKVNSKVNNVYVSANPNFNERMEGFMDKVRAGEPVEGMVEEFNTMVRRIFPANMSGLDRGLERSGVTNNNMDRNLTNTR